MSIVKDNMLTIPLYHGTSSLFLDSIIKCGLGGKNPINDWKILDLLREVFALSERHLQDHELFTVREQIYRTMLEQRISDGNMNFQHGQTYLSPSLDTAVGYASSTMYGSELITYTIDLLRELDRRDIAGVRTDLYKEFSDGYKLLDISPAPILIEAKGISVLDLEDELGNEPTAYIMEIENNLQQSPEIAEVLNQQINFRLLSAIPAKQLMFWLINVSQYNGWSKPDYKLYRITER